MGKEYKSRFNFLKLNFGWKIFYFSLFISACAVYILYKSLSPYNFSITEHLSGKLGYSVVYHDFDHDGYSEKLEIRNNGPDRFNILVRNWSGGTIDQANYWERIDIYGLMFADINGDGYDEILGFTQGGDSLYFYLHDLVAQKVIINRLFIGTLKEPISKERLVNFFPVCIADTSVYKSKVLIFVARSFTALKPRSVYALDLENKKIISNFNTGSAISGAFAYDLNGDGINEIIAFGYASGNVHNSVKYKDDKCWLFVLDQKLNPVFPPLSFSQYPSYFSCFPIDIYSGRYLLAVPNYFGEKHLDKFIYLINSEGKIYQRTQNPFNMTNTEIIDYVPIVNTSRNPSEIYAWQNDNKVIKLNHQLEIEKSVVTKFENPRPKLLKDINGDGKEEVFYTSKDYLLVYDEELNLLAKFPNPGNLAVIDFRQDGPGRPMEIVLSFTDKYFRLKLVEDRLFSLLPLFFFAFTGIVFLILSGGQRFSNRIATHNRILNYLRSDSSDGVLIADRFTSIVFINSSFIRILNLHPPPKKGETVTSVFNRFPQIQNIIKKSVELGKNINQKILLESGDFRFEGELSVHPYKNLFNRGLNYLIIIKSENADSHSGKIHTWSRTVQKMAHDIKTPLSTVSLNLKVLQTRLDRIHLSESEKNELSDDINMMRTELDNIQSMTKNFLKFTNLDKPHFQAFDISSTIRAAKNKFKSYINDDLHIDVAIDKDVKPVWADPQQTEMVFAILIENALAAVQGKGLISINVSTVQYLENIFRESLEIEVADTGPGIREEDKKRIFEPYYSTKTEGTGMGLAIAKKIIADNGGSIEVYSKPEFGAVFRFSLPVLKE